MRYRAIVIVSFILHIALIATFLTQSNATLGKSKKGKKERLGPRPDGIAYNNKNFPTTCHACRLMVEEITASLKGKDGELTEEQMKEKKRKNRRKTKAEKKREKSLPILVAIEEVCDKMLEYVPQEDKSKFRYIKTKDIRDANVLIKIQKETEEAGETLKEKYDQFRHPETNRLMSMCDDILSIHENIILMWDSIEEKDDLLDYLCKDKVFANYENDHAKCLEEESAKSTLWVSAFDAVLQKHPELKNQEF